MGPVHLVKTVLGQPIYIHTARKSCERMCLVGASIDAFGSMVHLELWFFIMAGKLACVIGALGVYLAHMEEASHEHEE